MSKTSKLDSRDPSSTSPRTALSPNPHSSPTTKSSTDSRISDSPTSNAAASTADDGPSQAAEHRAVRLHKKAKDGDDTLIADDSFPHCATVGSDSVATGASARFTTSGLTSVLVPDSPPANVLSPQEDLEPEQEQAAGTLSPNFDGSRASGCTLVKPDSGGSMTEPAQSAASRPSITSALNKSQVVDHVAVHSEDNTAAAAGLISAQVALERIQRAWTATQGLNHTPRNGNARLSSALTALSHVGAAWRSARSALLHATVFHIRP
ncbi:unnamed protein product [Tilletia controversa]|nr:unnamed protein product [Tilletia controversa]CAD6924071.1 unnamed protein product [Tilletia controversa]